MEVQYQKLPLEGSVSCTGKENGVQEADASCGFKNPLPSYPLYTGPDFPHKPKTVTRAKEE